MPQILSDRLLLAIATLLDHQRRFTRLSLVGAVPGDPRLYQHHRWMLQYLKERRKRQQLQKALYELKRCGYLQAKVFGATQGYLVTPKGEIKLFHLQSQMLRQQKSRPRLPDGKWLMVFFDVPESLRKKRDLFRRELIGLGFEQLQKSVWVTPYPVRDKLRALIRVLELERYAQPLMVEETTI